MVLISVINFMQLSTWLLAMVIAAAEVKPAMTCNWMMMMRLTMMMSTEMLVKTGKEKKSMRKPRRRKPAMRITIPVKKVSRMAYLGLGYN